MQSAITELNAIAVSAAIHDGWRTLEAAQGRRTASTIWIIEPSRGAASAATRSSSPATTRSASSSRTRGARAGAKGYATLPYEDWLANAYDAWVARPGVPQAAASPRPRKVMVASAVGLVAAAGPDLARLQSYVVDVDGGRPAVGHRQGHRRSPAQIAGLVTAMAADHDDWVAKETGTRRAASCCTPTAGSSARTAASRSPTG